MAKFCACWNQGLEIGTLFYDVSLEKRVVFSSAVCRTPPADIFLKFLRELTVYVGKLSDPVFESQNCLLNLVSSNHCSLRADDN